MKNNVVISSSFLKPHSFSNNPPQTDPAPHLDDTPHPHLSVKAQLSSSGSSTCDKQQNSHANQYRKFSHCPRRARAVFWSSWSTSTTFISTDRVGLSSHRSRWYTPRVRSQSYSHKQKQNLRTVWEARARDPHANFPHLPAPTVVSIRAAVLKTCPRDLSSGRRFESAPLSPARIPHLLLTASGRTLVEEAGLYRRRRGSDQSAAAPRQPIKGEEDAAALSWSDGIRPIVT